MQDKEYPRYYQVSDTVVCLEQHGQNIKGFVVTTGEPFAPAVAIVDGAEITKEQAEKLTAPYIKPKE